MATKKTTLYLPKGAKEKWSEIYFEGKGIPTDFPQHTPYLFATAIFEDGVSVVYGMWVYEDHAIPCKYCYVADAVGQVIPNCIDTSDEEDFRNNGYTFQLIDAPNADTYELSIVEKK